VEAKLALEGHSWSPTMVQFGAMADPGFERGARSSAEGAEGCCPSHTLFFDFRSQNVDF